MLNRSHYILSLALSLCVLLETLSLTYMQQNGGAFYYSSSILYFISGLGVSIIPILPISQMGKSLRSYELINKSIPFLTGIFFIVLFYDHLSVLIPLYRRFAIDKNWADMLPTIQVACQRFIDGKTVYARAPEIWDYSIIPYMPFMWMPFLPAVSLGFDLRWITFTAQFLGLLLIFIPLFTPGRKYPLIPLIIDGTGLFLLLNFTLMKRTDYWIMTEEGVIVAFYLLLSYTLLNKNYWLIGIAIMACTLSRYSLIFWIPVYFIYVLLTRPRSDFWKLLIAYGTSMSIFFILPFFIKDPSYFINIPLAYSKFTTYFWTQNKIDEHLYYSVGFFKFFRYQTIPLMSIFEVITSFSAPLIFLLILWRLKMKFALNERYIAYSSLKLSLAFFFGFIQMPYLYIFVPVTLMSYIVLFDYIALQNKSAHV